jgi:hypothetical protein
VTTPRVRVARSIVELGVSVFRIAWIPRAVCVTTLLLGLGGRADAQGVDLTLFVGRAFPIYDERLTLRPSTPTVPGVDVSVEGTPLIDADGGPVFGGALAFEFGVLGIEGRLDATEVGLTFTGARYNLRGIEPPFEGVTASVTISDGRFDADRIPLLSVNARLRTPGPVALIVSGGLSYLSDISVSGSIPLRVEIPGIPAPPGFNPRLTLVAVPGQSDHRWGVNGGAGLRIGGRVALIGEVRVFYFREYELRFEADEGFEVLDELLANLPPVRFDPVFINAQVGVMFRF